jgi:hypothetical protein
MVTVVDMGSVYVVGVSLCRCGAGDQYRSVLALACLLCAKVKEVWMQADYPGCVCVCLFEGICKVL